MAGGLFSTAGADLTKILSNPLAQAALGTYFGMISSPRRLGWGGALGRGGLAGLGQFAQAEQLQAQQPKLQAEAALDVTKAQQAKQQTATQQQMLDWLDKDPAAQKMDPQQRMILRLAVTSGHIQPGMLGLTPYQQGLLGEQKQRTALEKQKADAYEAQQRALQGTYPALSAEREAAAQRSQAEAGAVPSEIAERQASAQRSRAETGAVPSEISARQAAAAHSQAGAAVERARLAGKLPTAPERPDVVAAHEVSTALNQERLKQLQKPGVMSEIGGMLGFGGSDLPAHAHTGEGLPPGSRANGDGTWTLPDGKTRVRPK